MEGTYHHLTREDRRTLFRLLTAKLPIKEIASQLGRHRSTLYREIAHIADAAGGIDWDVQ